MNSMTALPTVYRGIKFRSRLEARWAHFLDALDVDWQYEPQGYTACDVAYLPDFWLSNVASRGVPGGLFLEIKPCRPTEEEEIKARMLALGSGRPVVIAARAPLLPHREHLLEYVASERGTWDDEGLHFAKCADCGQVNVGYFVRDRQCTACQIGLSDPHEATLMKARTEFNERARWRAA
jgi:hypothetical protein